MFYTIFYETKASFSVHSTIFFLYSTETKKDSKKYFYGTFKSIVALVQV